MVTLARIVYTVLLAVVVGLVTPIVMVLFLIAGIIIFPLYWEGVVIMILVCSLAAIPWVGVLTILILCCGSVMMRSRVVGVE